MLQMYVFAYLLEKEAGSRVVSGRVTGWSLSHFRKAYSIPKSTFYRHINQMIESRWIVKQGRDRYTLTQEIRRFCNQVADAEEVR